MPDKRTTFVPRCTCAWRGQERPDNEQREAVRDAVAHREASADPNCDPWVEWMGDA